MADALRETGDLSKLKKASIVAAVSALSLGLGVLMFLYQGDVPSDMGSPVSVHSDINAEGAAFHP
jgi:hypothetical protein